MPMDAMRRTATVALALTMIAIAGPAAAQRITTPYAFLDRSQELAVFAGYLGSETGHVGPGLGVEAAPIFGVRYAIRLTGPFNFEADAFAMPTSRAVVDTTTQDGATAPFAAGSEDVTLAVVNAGLRFDLTGPRTFHRLLPYFAAGVGAVVRAKTSTPDVEVDPTLQYRPGTRFAANLGAGIEWIPSPSLGIRVDARNYLWRVKTPAGFLTASSDVPATEWLSHFGVSVGLTYRF